MSLPYPESKRLASLAEQSRDLTTLELFEKETDRTDTFSLEAAGLKLDFSRNRLSKEGLEQLRSLAGSAKLADARKSLFDGRLLNHTEARAVSHTLLRADAAPHGLEREFSDVRSAHKSMQQWVDRVSSGQHRGFAGERIKHIINLGIGGSDLGPRMVCQALAGLGSPNLDVRFCANIDPVEFKDTVKDLSAANTLFIVCSKAWSTEETLANAQAARSWLIGAGCSITDLDKHLLAVSANLQSAEALGIPAANVLPLWDWVGGRYSLWSAIGWSIAFSSGYENFQALLAGAKAMDDHFASAPIECNMPMTLSLLEIWHANFLGAQAHAVVPYSHRLRRLPAFLQQLTMESNGKQTNRQGKAVDYATAPILWGDEGSNGQHSFHQLLHQGTVNCPVDFILPLQGEKPGDEQHNKLIANGLAQARALMIGRSEKSAREELTAQGLSEKDIAQLAPHLVIAGNRSSNVITFERLEPKTVGALLALYEHRTFCSGHIWQINSFDQFGVELGKVLSSEIYSAMVLGNGEFDPATDAQLCQIKAPDQ